jgi:hypothetical protein
VPAEFEGPLFLEPRRSFPYAGTIRIRFKGFPRCLANKAEAQAVSQPLSEAPLGIAEVSRDNPGIVKRGRLACGSSRSNLGSAIELDGRVFSEQDRPGRAVFSGDPE